MKQINIDLNPKTRKNLNKFIRGLMFFTAFLLFFAAFMLPSLVLEGKHSNNLIAWTVLLIFMLFIIAFSIICLILAIKFKYELTLNDAERVLKWDKLSSEYKKFWIFQEVFALVLGFFLITLGFIFAFYFKDWFAIVAVMASLSMLISVRRAYLDIKDKKEAKILKKIVSRIAIIFLIILILLLIVWLSVNFGKMLL